MRPTRSCAPPAGEGAEAVPPAEAAPSPAAAAGETVNPLEQRARLAEDRLAEVLAAYRKLKTDNEEFRDRQSRNIERRFDHAYRLDLSVAPAARRDGGFE